MKLPDIDKNILLGVAAVGAGLLVLTSRDEPIDYGSGGGGAGSNEEEYKKSIEGGAEPTIINFPEMPAASVTTKYPDWLRDWGKDEPIPTDEPIIPATKKGVYVEGDPLVGYSTEQKDLIRKTISELQKPSVELIESTAPASDKSWVPSWKPWTMYGVAPDLTNFLFKKPSTKPSTSSHPQATGSTFKNLIESAGSTRHPQATGMTPGYQVSQSVRFPSRKSGNLMIERINTSSYSPKKKKLNVTYRDPSGKPI